MGEFDTFFNKRALLILRLSIGIVYVWFGLLKIFDVSPVERLITSTYSFLPYDQFGIALGIFETIIGLGFLLNYKLRYVIMLFWMQMVGVFGSVILNPAVFGTNILRLSLEGEFMVKNLVLFAASLVLFNSERTSSRG